MPTSDYHHISDVLHVVEQLEPKSVLEVGIGFGKWGLLCREVMEIYQGRVQPESWIRNIDGVEINEPYRNPLWDIVYSTVYIGDAFDVIDQLGHYDLILCCDVIEHFEKDVGRQFLQKMLYHGTAVIVTSPRGYAPQGAVYDNVNETHRSGWISSDFSGIPHLYKDVGFTFVALLSTSPGVIKPIQMRHPLDVLGVKRGALEIAKMTGERVRKRILSGESVRET